MTKYDKIWVPYDYPTDYEVCRIETGNPIKGWVDAEEDVIVLTMDELREVWEAGYQRGGTALSRIKNQGPKPPSFTDFLQQKGVTL